MKKIYFPLTACLMLFFLGCQKTENIPQAPAGYQGPITYDYSNAFLANSNRFDSVVRYSTASLDVVNGIYGQNINYYGDMQDLPFIFKAPALATDTLKKRPLVIFLHGGGFIDGGYDDDTSIISVDYFAQRGYAAASIEYRLGWNTGGKEPSDCSGDTTSMAEAVYRSVQDLRAALRYFTANASEYGIDPNQIFLFGSSAGNVAATATTFMTQEDFDAIIPNVQNSLGSLNTASNTLRNSYNIQALLTKNGFALFNKNYISLENCKPIFFMQGTNDEVLPFSQGTPYYCPHYATSYGSDVVKTILESYKFPYIQYAEIGGVHRVDYPLDFAVNQMCKFIKNLWSANYLYSEYQNYTQVRDQKIN
ncbi:MAG: alpha/beta hydrolase [Chitinophagaceae bacterium]